MLPQVAQPVDEDMAIDRLMSLWRGDTNDEYATAAITGTLAVALKALGRVEDIAGAYDMAAAMWGARDKGRLAA